MSVRNFRRTAIDLSEAISFSVIDDFYSSEENFSHYGFYGLRFPAIFFDKSFESGRGF